MPDSLWQEWLSGQTLVWDEFFDLHVPDPKKAKYTLNRLAAMNPDQLTDVIGEYFWSVFYRFYQENGLGNSPIYDPGILLQMGLPCDADSTTIKKRFRALAKQVHPDTGGDSDRFIELISNYRKLTERE
jgi:hypothetical protein